MSSKRVGVLVALIYITVEVQLMNDALFSLTLSFSLTVISNTLPLPSERRMVVNVHPSVELFRRNVEGEMRRMGEEERVMFTKDMSVSARFPFTASIRDEGNPVVNGPSKPMEAM